MGLVLSYLVGSVPFGLIACYLVKGVDVRKHGSGNIGATNVARVAGRPTAVIVFILDMLKGFLPTLYLSRLAGVQGSLPAILCGCSAILGHSFPITLRFRGGKAVATSTGVFLALSPLCLLVSVVVWVGVAVVWRYVSLASMCAGVGLFLACLLGGVDSAVIAFAGLVALLVIARHRFNIKRLLAGTEPRIGQGSANHSGR